MKAFVHRDALTTNGDQITCKESLSLDFLGVEKIPDLSNVTINGKFNANQIRHVNMNDLPFASKGYFLVNTTIENCDKVDAQTFCRKLGMEYKNGVWDISNTNISGKFIGCPKNFADTPIKDLNFIDLSVNDLNEIPVTKDGANEIKIMNQESIREMNPDLFLRKINGDNYDKFPDGKTLNPNYKMGLNLERTNIVELPKGLENYQIECIIFPENETVKSLDNIPITKEGCFNLKYAGDLSKETTESFLLKTKGKDWCAEHLSKAADGHLIVNGEIDFNTPNYSNNKSFNLDISSFPHDIDKVEFKGRIKPIDFEQSLRQHLELTSQKNNERISVYNSKKFNYDLSDFKAKDINVSHDFKSIKLPECAEKLTFADIDNLKLSSVNLSNKVKDINLINVKSSENLDLSKQTHIGLSDCNLQNVSFPDKCANIRLSNTNFSEAIKLPTQANRVDLSNVKFENGCTVSLSDCEVVNLSNCKFPEGSSIDLSGCKKVLLDNVDLSKVDIKLPEQGKIYIDENVKFAPERTLDFSKCQDAVVHPSAECSEIKLPAKGDVNFEYTGKLHKNVKEVTAEYISKHRLMVPEGVKIIDAPMENGKKVSLERLSEAGVSKKQIANLRKERILKPFEDVYNRLSGKNKKPKTPTVNENTSDLGKTLKQQADKNVEVLKETSQTQGKSNGSLGSQAAAVNNGIDNALEKVGNKLNDNALGRAINKADSWRPHNKTAAKVMDKVGAVPVAAVVASGVSAYEQYKSGDEKGAAATFGKGVVHATVQGVATSAGMNIAAKGASKAAAKVTEKVVARQAAKAASKQVAKAAGKAAGKAVGKSVLKKIPLVSLGAGAYFAFERAKNGEWGKAGCELLSGALGCFPGVGTAASTAVDCGLAVADTKQAINETKKQQAAEQAKKEQTPKPQQNQVLARRVAELRGIKPAQSQKKPVQAKKTFEKSTWDKFTDLFSR